jgi:hypothetical protein
MLNPDPKPTAIWLAHESGIAGLPNKPGQVVIRNNRFLLAEGDGTDAAVLSAMVIDDLTRALVVENLFETDAENPDLAKIGGCKSVGWYNNYSLDGELIAAPEGSEIVRQDNIEKQLEELTTQAFFKQGAL